MQFVIDEIFYNDERIELSTWLQFARNFMKVQFGQNVQKNDGDGFYTIGHSLTRSVNREKTCRFPGCTICSSTPALSRRHCSEYAVGDHVILIKGKNLESVVEIVSKEDSLIVP